MSSVRICVISVPTRVLRVCRDFTLGPVSYTHLDVYKRQEYSHREILNFLMSPGFSTNTEVTEFSGRGVGMDVVKQNVEAVGGTVSLTSELGKGMTTTLKIPLTTAIMDGMEVSVGGSIFTIPIHNIRQSFKIHSDQLVHDAAGGEIFKCMGSFYPCLLYTSRCV